MKTLTLLKIYAGALAVLGGWIWYDQRSFIRTYRGTRKMVEDTSGVRVPHPEEKVPTLTESWEFEMVEEAVCEAIAKVEAGNVDEAAQLALKSIVAEYPWPAVAGDHPSALEMQGIVAYEVRRRMMDPSSCES